MTTQYEETQYREDEYGNPHMKKRGGGAPLLGFMVGGLIGAVSMLLFAPQSGRETRGAVQEGATNLKDRKSFCAVLILLDLSAIAQCVIWRTICLCPRSRLAGTSECRA